MLMLNSLRRSRPTASRLLERCLLQILPASRCVASNASNTGAPGTESPSSVSNSNSGGRGGRGGRCSSLDSSFIRGGVANAAADARATTAAPHGPFRPLVPSANQPGQTPPIHHHTPQHIFCSPSTLLTRSLRTTLPHHHLLPPLLTTSAMSTAARGFASSSQVPEYPGRMLVVQPGFDRNSDAALQEALRLAESLGGAECPHLTLGAHAVRAATYIGRGSVERVAEEAQALGAERIFVNAVLTAVQQRNLETAWGMTVLDRVALIINIFADRALTREAKLQVELADLEFKASRLVRGRNVSGARGTFADAMEVVSARERGRTGSSSGGLGGAAGGGESEIRVQRQRIVKQRKMLQTRLNEVQSSREQQRKRRKRSGIYTVALVGYTNAGKSSLMSAMTDREAEVADQLFATLDPLLARCQLPSGRSVVLSDTVGFITDLPHQLVDAFRATLEEVVQAEVLVHVIDASSPAALEQREAVLTVLRELGFSDEDMSKRVIEVWNKVDLLLPGPEMVSEGRGSTTHGSASETRASAGPDFSGASNGADVVDDGEPQGLLLQRLERQFELLTEGSGVRPKRVLVSADSGLGLRKLGRMLDRRIRPNLGAEEAAYGARKTAKTIGPRKFLVDLATATGGMGKTR